MKFIDEVEITVAAGRGGDGRVGFRREKFVPRGGPDGGDGGGGGDVYFQADEGLNTLVSFRGKKLYAAQDGEGGGPSQRHGKSGADLVIDVPVGTVVQDTETGQILADLIEHQSRTLAAKGGRGGLGNVNFKSATNQAPKFATQGKEGETLEVRLELKILADISLIGMPNVGKSTLISVISKAKPKIADYDFTTLEPNLGVVSLGDRSFVVADIPGLIENASQGKGLGTKFLKHIERTKVFVHIIDISWCLDTYEALDAYTTVRNEIERYNPALIEKKEIVCFSKTDALRPEDIEKFQNYFEEIIGIAPLPISSVAHKNIERLKILMLKNL